MNNERQGSKIRTVMSEQRDQIFKWLYNLTEQQIKDVLTIRNEHHLKLINGILFRKDENNNILSTKQVTQSGFSYIKGQDKMMLRSTYKFKLHSGENRGKNKQLHQIADNLYSNLSISRSPPHEVSIKRAFLKDIKNCME